MGQHGSIRKGCIISIAVDDHEYENGDDDDDDDEKGYG